MFGMGASEILVILVVALIFLGPEKLPDAAAKISKGIRDIRKQTRELTTTIENDTEIGGAIRDIKSALRGDEPRPRPKPQLQSVPAARKADPPAPPGPRLPEAAGEAAPAPDDPTGATGDAAPSADEGAELANLVRPAVGTVAKGGDPPS